MGGDKREGIPVPPGSSLVVEELIKIEAVLSILGEIYIN